MIRRLVLAVCAGAVAGYLARCELARRRAAPQRHATAGNWWLIRAAGVIRAGLGDEDQAVTLTVAVRDRDGFLTAWTMRPGDAAPVIVLGTETALGDGRTAVEFCRVPDSPARAGAADA